MGIDSRLRHLEERGHGRCPECGLPPNGPREIAVINEERPEAKPSFEGDPHASCAVCGQSLYTVIRVVYGRPRGYEGEGA